MAVGTIVNKFGTLTGWNSSTFNIYGRDLEGISEFEYDDEISRELVYGAGRMPIGESEGNYKPSVKCNMLLEEFRALLDALPAGKRIQDASTNGIVSYATPSGKVYKDIIHDFRILKAGVAFKQGDGKMYVPLTCLCSHITWNAL